MAFNLNMNGKAYAAALAACLIAVGTPAPAQNVPDRLGGDLGGLRSSFAKAGLALGIAYVGETLGVVSGGAKRDFTLEGVLGLSLEADLETLAGWPDATFHVSGIGVHGRGPSEDLLGGNIMAVSSIEARSGARLYTLWLEQSLADDRLAIRLGQLAADDEFMVSDTAGNLINGTFGWAVLASENMLQGGPAYPLPAPGVRVRLSPMPNVTVLGGVFSGNPGGDGCADDAQVCNDRGTTFSLSGGALWLGELQYAARLGALPGTYKLGGWHETGSFARFSGATEHGDYGLYAIADQMVWRRQGTEDQGLSVFLRLGAAPEDRNFVSWYVDGGLGFKGPFGRADDVIALGVAYGGISDDAASAARAAWPGTPVPDHESVIELSYTAQIRPGWTLQPDLQYVIHPGAGSVVDDALVLGLRTSLAF